TCPRQTASDATAETYAQPEAVCLGQVRNVVDLSSFSPETLRYDHLDGACSKLGRSFVQSTGIHSTPAVRDTTSWRKATSKARKPSSAETGVTDDGETE